MSFTFLILCILSFLRISRGIPWLWNEVIDEEGGYCAPQPEKETNSCSTPDGFSFYAHALSLYLPLFLVMIICLILFNIYYTLHRSRNVKLTDEYNSESFTKAV
nr:uncharacterized protein LOC106685441 [Halyomorpha halys]